MLRDLFLQVATEFPSARKQKFGGHKLNALFSRTFGRELLKAIGSSGSEFESYGSRGNGNWVEIPWVGVFHALTHPDGPSALKGYYIVYLFNADCTQLCLSLNQGTTSVKEEFGKKYIDILKQRSAVMRSRLSKSDNIKGLKDFNIKLNGRISKSKAYEAGHALGKVYALTEGKFPEENVLIDDLKRLCRAYKELIYMGGLELDNDEAESESERSRGRPLSVIEKRQYRLHRRIDRNPEAGKLAKEYHGFICQVCGFDFKKKYGDLGEGYIEAHHLKPLSGLDKDVTVSYDIPTDFAVLCANCHRMIHRTDDVSDLKALRRQII